MSDIAEGLEEMETALASFVDRFELVFENDWELTKDVILDNCFIADDATFISPGVEDEENNWANRARLLESYRKLREVMKKHDLSTEFDEFKKV